MKKIRILVIIIILVLLAGLFVGETYLRIFEKQKLIDHHYPLIYQTDSILGYTYIPNYKDYYQNSAILNTCETNKEGFIGKDFSKVKRNGTYRILFVGSSVTAGIEVYPYRYTDMLQKELEKKYKNIEIINCSIDGKCDYSLIKLIELKCAKYKPDAIFFSSNFPLTNWNDYRYTYKGYVIKFRNGNSSLNEIKAFIDSYFCKKNTFTILYRHSYLFRGVCRYYINNKSPFIEKTMHFCFFRNLSLNNTKDAVKFFFYKIAYDIYEQGVPYEGNPLSKQISVLKHLNDTLKEQSIKLTVFSFFNGNNSFNTAFFSELGIDYLPLNIKYDKNYSFGEDDGHLTKCCHKIIADSLFKNIIKYPISCTKESKFICKEKTSIKGNLIINRPQKFTTDSFRIVSFYEKDLIDENNKTFLDLLEARLKTDKHKIKLAKIEIPSFKSIEDYISFVNSYGNSLEANLVIAPQVLYVNNGSFHQCLTFFKQYIDHSTNNYRQILFYGLNAQISYVYSKYKIPTIANIYDLIYVNSEGDLFYNNRLNQYISKLMASHAFNELIRNAIVPNNFKSKFRNVSFKKSVYDSDNNYKKTWSPWSPSNLTDGEIYTIEFWAGSRGWKSKEFVHDTTIWITIDLNQKTQISKIILYPRNSSGNEGDGFPVDFCIKLSSDNIHWSNVVQMKNQKKVGILPKSYLIQQSNARFIKIEIQKMSNDNAEKKYYTSFAEIEVYSMIETSPAQNISPTILTKQP